MNDNGTAKENTLKQLMEAFSCPGRPVTAPEFTKFWRSLTPEEQAYYKSAPLG